MHASEEEDLDDDVTKLTEQNKAVNDHLDLTLLQNLAVKLDESDSTGEAVHQQLAEIATIRWSKKLSSDKVKRQGRI